MAIDVRSKKWLWVGVLAAVVVLAFGVLACGGSSDGPEKTVEAMIAAMEVKDVDALVAIMDPQGIESIEQQGATLEQFKAALADEMPYESMKFEGLKFETEISEDGQSATVTVVEGKVTTVMDGETTVEDVQDSDEPQAFQLVLRDGKWYLDMAGM